jgi:hypothetical protein
MQGIIFESNGKFTKSSIFIELKNTMDKPRFENDFASFWIEGGIVYFVYKPNSVVSLEAARKIVDDRIKFQKQKDFPIYCDIRGMKSADKDARNYLAKEGSSYARAVAVVVDSPMSKIIGNIYLGLNKPITPSRLFTDEKDAVEYLKQFASQYI